VLLVLSFISSGASAHTKQVQVFLNIGSKKNPWNTGSAVNSPVQYIFAYLPTALLWVNHDYFGRQCTFYFPHVEFCIWQGLLLEEFPLI
jgi:hypothetical protein